MMPILELMRQAAYARHLALWAACGANHPWQWHVAVITAVYGW